MMPQGNKTSKPENTMKRPNITPGTRHIEKNPPDSNMFTVYANDDTEICECHKEEDARAIAAIPALFEALEAMLAFRDEEPPPSSDLAKETDYILRGIEADDKARSALIAAGYQF